MAHPRAVCTTLFLFGVPLASTAAASDPPLVTIIRTSDGKELPSRILDTDVKPKETIQARFDECKVSEVRFDEKERSTRFEEEIAKVLSKLTPVDRATDDCPKIRVTTPYEIQYPRSTIKVIAKKTDNSEVTRTLIYGPKESLFLAIDYPVSNRKALKYNADTHTLVPKEDKSGLYFSVNYSFGDVLTEPDELKGLERLELKLLLQASRKPLDSYGVALGYQVPSIKIDTWQLKGLSVFGGYFSTREDSVTNGVPQLGNTRKGSWRIGVSYDLGTALDWVKLK